MDAQDKNTAGETETVCVAPTTAVASTSHNSTMALALEKAASQRNEPNSQINQKSVEISEQSRQSMEHWNRKDKTIENISSEPQNLEIRLQAAGTGKMDALARLDKIEGTELELRFKETKVSLEWERLNSTIERLTEDLNKNVAELTATRQENVSMSAQFEIEKKGLSEQLKIANLSIDALGGTNETLKAKQTALVHKLREKLTESATMKKAYEDKLRVEAERYNENWMAYENWIDELAERFNEVQRRLNETMDWYAILETRLKERELDHQAELKAIVELATDHSMTFTGIYSQWQSVCKQLQHKEEECKLLGTDLKRLIKESNGKTIHFDRQQIELEQVRAANQQHIDERNCFLAEKVVSREALESSRLQCELLKGENDKLKIFGNEFLCKLISNDQPNDRLNLPNVSGAGTKSNIVELEQRNKNLLVIICNLMEKLQEAYDQLIEISAADALATSATTVSNVCHKRVAVSGNGLMSTDNSDSNSDNANRKSPTENLIIIEELKRDNHELQNAKRELIAGNNLLLAEQSLFDARYNVLNNKIASQDKQLQKNENIIEENKYLKDENLNISMKLSTVQDRLFRVESQHRTLCHIKNALAVEAEASKQEFIQEKVANKILGQKVEKMKRSLSRMKSELHTNSSYNFECRVQKWINEKVEHPSQGNISKPSMDEAVQTNFENGNHPGRDTDICNETGAKKNTCLDSLQLDKSEPQKTVAECSLQSHSSATASIRKQKTQNAAEGAESSEESDEGSDEDIDVGGVDTNCELPNIKLQYLSEVKTRKQANFIRDAFNCKKSEADLNVKPDQKVEKTNRKRAHSNDRSNETRRSSNRSRFAGSSVQKSNVGRQQSKGARNMDADKNSTINHQPNTNHQKSNVDGQQSTSGVNEDNRRRSRHVSDRLGQ